MKKILSITLLLCIVLGMMPITASADVVESGTCGENLTWTLDSEGTLTISGEGAMEDYDNSLSMPWKDFERDIKSLMISDGVTAIGNNAFHGCYITELTIPDSVTRIGEQAFYFCVKLSNITIGNNVTIIEQDAFSHSQITELTIPDSVTSMGYGAFRHCDELETVVIGDGLESISTYAFWFCSKLKEVEFGNSVTTIDSCAFQHCASLTNITLPDSLVTIGGGAFYSCDNLVSINIPDSVTHIENEAFYRCEKLTDVVVGKGVTNIGEEAFAYCPRLENITVLSEKVSSIGNMLLDDTSYYNNAENWTDGVLYLGNYLIEAERNIKGSCVIKDGTICIADNAFSLCDYFESVTIPTSVKSIGVLAFFTCNSLSDVYYKGTKDEWENISIEGANEHLIYAVIHFSETVIIAEGTCGDNLTWKLDSDGILTINGTGDIYNYGPEIIFDDTLGGTTDDSVAVSASAPWEEYYSKIKRIIINDGVTGIGNEAFLSLTRLTEVVMPETLTHIGDAAFDYCPSLTSVNLPESLVTIGDCAFRSCSSLETLTIPKNVINIGECIFEYFAGIKNIYVAEENQNYSSIDGVLANKQGDELLIYPAGRSQTSYTIPEKITRLGRFCFNNSDNLTEVVIHNNVKSIADYAFASCNVLTWITIPESVTEIGVGAFIGCSLQSFAIPESVKHIEAYTFYGCVDMTSVTITDSLESIGDEAFEYCSDLEDVYYNSTQAEWEEIDIGAANDYLLNAAIHYNCTFDAAIDADVMEAEGAFLAIVDLGENNNSKRIVFDGQELYYSPQRGKYVGLVSGDMLSENKLTDVVIANAAPTSFIYGNLDDDDGVDGADLQAMKLAIKGASPFTGKTLIAADVDGDGLFDGVDLQAMKLYIKKGKQFPVLK